MKHWLSIGYLGKESGNFTLKNPEEPIVTIDKIVKFLNIEAEKSKVDVDFELIWQGSTKQEAEDIKTIWRKIDSKKNSWNELKPLLQELLKLGEDILPIAFGIKFKNLEIEVVDGEFYFIICSDDKNKLENLSKVFDDLSQRIKLITVQNPLKIEIK